MLPPPPAHEVVRLGFDNRHRYWNHWLGRWVLPPIGIPPFDVDKRGDPE